jgi:putative ABC transport system permease protein
VKLGAELKDPPPEIEYLALGSEVCIITPPGDASSCIWLSDAPDSAGFAEYAAEVTSSETFLQGRDAHVEISDIGSQVAAQRDLVRLVMVFLYGFIGLLILIGLTNVISTISTNIRMRSREFAVLASAGMAQDGLKRMLSLESIFCGIKSLAFGLPIGIGLSYLIYQRFTDLVSYPYEFPWIPVAASIAGVFLITFATMRFSSARVRRGTSIIEAIRGIE